MENLTKQQIVLLTLLVSFVTSIATGIVTVALMNQAPVGITQTINRVVERTIERVVSEPSNPTQTVVKETVVVKADDLVVSAIDKNAKSVIRIYRTEIDPTSQSSPMAFVGLGFVVSEDGIIATDKSLIFEGGKYFTTLSDKKLHNLSILRSKAGEQVALLKPIFDDKGAVEFSKVSLSSQNEVKLGQTVIYVGGENKNIVSTGIVSGLGTRDVREDVASTTASTTPAKAQTVVVSIETNFPTRDLLSGAPLLNLSGEVVGIKANFLDSARSDLFVPSKSIVDSLASLVAEQKKTQ